MGNANALRNLNARDFTTERFGVPTVTDILRELEKPGRDPRSEFKTATFAEGVETLNDLTPGMILEGAVTNVTNLVLLWISAFIRMVWCISLHWPISLSMIHISGESRRYRQSQSDGSGSAT